MAWRCQHVLGDAINKNIDSIAMARVHCPKFSLNLRIKNWAFHGCSGLTVCLAHKPDTLCCIHTNHYRLGFYAEIQISFGTVYCTWLENFLNIFNNNIVSVAKLITFKSWTIRFGKMCIAIVEAYTIHICIFYRV